MARRDHSTLIVHVESGAIDLPQESLVLKSLRVKKYRAFEDFNLHFQSGAYLMGPNSAGKTSLITALRVSQTLLRHARTRRASEYRVHEGMDIRGYPVNLRDYPSLMDSIRHEFGSDETSIRLEWTSGAKMTVVWPDESAEDDSPYFYLLRPDGFLVETPAVAKDHFGRLGIVPPLGPVEHEERVLDETYVRANLESRLASRHFRNQLALMTSQEWEAFEQWSMGWLGGLAIELPSIQSGDYTVFYAEPGSRIPKEITWAGDGIQIWIQILYHLFRTRDCETLVLDEPEVFLHPDMQRRLVALLESTGKQIILATHSAEIAAEVDPEQVALVDKSKGRAIRAKTGEHLELLSQAIGSSFNLRLAKAIRSSRVIFVEGQDMKILRILARTLKLDRLVAESGITVVQLGGFSSWDHVQAFAWLTRDLLPGAVEISVILDRDYHCDAEIESVVEELRVARAHSHIWSRKELESFLIDPVVVARASGAPLDIVQGFLDLSAERQRNDVFGQMTAFEHRFTKSSVDLGTKISSGQGLFDAQWASRDFRLWRTNAKDLISTLNVHLMKANYTTLTASKLARAHRASEIPIEMRKVLETLNDTGPLFPGA